MFKRLLIVAIVLISGALSGCTRPTPEPSSLAKGIRVCAVGDSNTQAWAPPVPGLFPDGWGVKPREQYLYRLLKRLEPGVTPSLSDVEPWVVTDPIAPADDRVIAGDEYAFFNLGVYGSTTRDALDRWDSQVSPLSPQIVIIMLGTNDISLGREPRMVFDDLMLMTKATRALGASPVLCTIPPTGNTEPRIVAGVRELNELIRSVPASEAAIVDVNAALDPDGSNDNPYPLYGSDPLHFNADGHEVIADAFELDLFRP